MSRQLPFTLGGLLPCHLSPQVRALYWSSILQNLALAMLILFEPIYLWQQGFGLRGIVWFFLGVYVAYFLLAPVGANFATQKGFERSMVVSTLFQVIYYTCLFLIVQSWWFVLPAFIFYALQKAFYWPAYHADFARYADESEGGREVSGLSVALALVYVAGPVLAGFLLTIGSWSWLFIVGGIILLLSNWPLLKTPEVFVPRRFPYLAALARLFTGNLRRPLLANLGFGEELIIMILWPVFMYVVVVSYATVGVVVAVSTFIMALVTLYIGKLTDVNNKKSVLRFATIIYVLSWLGRLIVASPLGVFLVDAWSRITKSSVVVPLTALTYERARRQSFMDTAVFFEMSLSLGKIIAAVLLLLIFTVTTSWGVIWLVAALMAMLYAAL
ncbi:MAG: MFS transporter [Candidatus Kerfeldbacteria bacterium]|nr:MFS transporter [Candidatus Kerfeldbacteria bacterium]